MEIVRLKTVEDWKRWKTECQVYDEDFDPPLPQLPCLVLFYTFAYNLTEGLLGIDYEYITGPELQEHLDVLYG